MARWRRRPETAWAEHRTISLSKSALLEVCSLSEEASTQTMDGIDRIEKVLVMVPPYRHLHCPPAAASALLGHLRAADVTDVRFLDLRLLAPNTLRPTFNPVGIFGESFVIDVPDLPLVLGLLRAHDDRSAISSAWELGEIFTRYCETRAIDPRWLKHWLSGIEHLLEDTLNALQDLTFVGFSVWSSNLTTTLMAASMLKRRSNPPFIVVGGPQVTESLASAQLGLESGLFDAVVIGEGESALLEVLRSVERGEPPTSVPRVVTRSYSGISRGSRLPLLKMNGLAVPNFEEMSLASYRAPDQPPMLPFQLSRGCTDKCSFCSEWVFWERFRPDSVEHAVNQIQQLHEHYGVNRFHFTDSLLNGNMPRLRAFAAGLLERGLQLNWGGFMRAQMDADTASLLRAAGCTYAYVGVESFSDETLAAMNKRRTRVDNLQAIDTLLDAGIYTAIGVIPGFPGDTRERFLATARELVTLAEEHPNTFSFNVEPFVVSPAQPIFQDLAAVGLTKHPWSDEVLAIAPRYRRITEQIACTVEGRNQGSERLGQLLHLDAVQARHGGSGSRVASIDLPPDRARFIDLGPGILVLVEHRGRIVGRLLTQAEKSACGRIVASGVPGQPLFEREAFRRFWDDVTNAHAWVPQRRQLPSRTRRSITQARTLYVPDHVVGRIFDDGHPVLVITHTLNHAVRSLPASISPILANLSERPQSLTHVIQCIPSAGELETIKLLDELHELGYIDVVT